MKKQPLLCLALIAISAVSYAQSPATAKPEATLDLVIKNSPKQIMYVHGYFRDDKYNFRDTIKLGEKGAVDSLHYDLTVHGKEMRFILAFADRKQRSFVPVIAPGEHLKITSDRSTGSEWKFSGSAKTTEIIAFSDENQVLAAEWAKDMLGYREAVKNGSADSTMFKAKFDLATKARTDLVKKVAMQTNGIYLTSMALTLSQLGKTFTAADFDQLRSKFNDDPGLIKEIDFAQKLQDKPHNMLVQPPALPANGTFLAGFNLPNLDNQQMSLAQFKGKYVLVDFWASWCGPCRAESPYLKQAVAKYGKSNFMILSVSVDKDHAAWKKAIKDDGLYMFTHLIDDRDPAQNTTKQYNITGIPTNFLLDPDGKIVAQNLRGDRLAETLEKMLK